MVAHDWPMVGDSGADERRRDDNDEDVFNDECEDPFHDMLVSNKAAG